ncbi:MAG: PqqD family protein [Pirellulaceae bacterium]|nr:PqqD family protein [Pirellulaceae bacterium]
MLELLEAVVEMVIVEAEVEVLPTKKSDVVFRRVGDGGVLLATQEEIYFGLNAVGVQIWELLTPENQTVGDVVGKLAEIYPDAEAPDLRMDLAEFLGELTDQGLLNPSPTS